MTRFVLAIVITFLSLSHGHASTDRACLHQSVRHVLQQLEAKFGAVKVVSTCRPGARMPSGHKSWHATGRAVDFIPPPGRRGEVISWLSKHSPGVTMTYRRMAHVHTDTGTFHKTIWNARDEREAQQRLAVWKARGLQDVYVALPGMKETMEDTRYVEDYYAVPHDEHSYAELRDIVVPEGYALAEVPAIFRPLVSLIEYARGYLVQTASLGGTMRRQGVDVAIGRLHPEFAKRLAASIEEARRSGLPDAGCYSAYRPPGFGVGGYRNKFDSNHAYGLACDVSGIGRPGSVQSMRWHAIATRHGLYNPYRRADGSVIVRVEWNHYQLTPTVTAVRAKPALRRTITRDGPVDVERMWHMADALIDVRVGGSVRVKRARRVRIASR